MGLRKEEGLVIATLFRFTTFGFSFISALYLSIGKIRFTLKGAFLDEASKSRQIQQA